MVLFCCVMYFAILHGIISCCIVYSNTLCNRILYFSIYTMYILLDLPIVNGVISNSVVLLMFLLHCIAKYCIV